MKRRRMSGQLKARLEKAKGVDWRKKHFKKQGGLCIYCDTPMRLDPPPDGRITARLATLDHLVPTSRGGAHHWENTAAACHRCNQAKRDKTAEEFCPTKFAPPLEEPA